MKKSRYNRKRERRLNVIQNSMCRFLADYGRKCKVGSVSMKLKRGGLKSLKILIFDDFKERQFLVSWEDNRFFALPYNASVAKPYQMTLAKWKSIYE